jgi:hypothetical protein
MLPRSTLQNELQLLKQVSFLVTILKHNLSTFSFRQITIAVATKKRNGAKSVRIMRHVVLRKCTLYIFDNHYLGTSLGNASGIILFCQ